MGNVHILQYVLTSCNIVQHQHYILCSNMQLESNMHWQSWLFRVHKKRYWIKYSIGIALRVLLLVLLFFKWYPAPLLNSLPIPWWIDWLINYVVYKRSKTTQSCGSRGRAGRQIGRRSGIRSLALAASDVEVSMAKYWTPNRPRWLFHLCVSVSLNGCA